MAGPFDICQVLEKEYEELYGALPPDYPRDAPRDAAESDQRLAELFGLIHKRAKDDNKKRTALCFSGGGIRSATFGLGVLQGLAQRGLLSEFDYLSTVSGGGYLGGWFSAWLKREAERIRLARGGGELTLADSEQATRKIQEALTQAPKPKLQPEREQVRHLRSYSNYMSPKLGLLSADTWTLAAIYFRNLFLNWLVLVPLILGVLALPRLVLALTRWGGTRHVEARWIDAAFWLAVTCGVAAITYIIANRPSIADASHKSGKSRSRVPKEKRDEWSFLKFSLLPLLLLAFLITTYWAWLRTDYGNLVFAPLGFEMHTAFAFALFGVLLYGGAYVVTQASLVRGLLITRPLLLSEPFVAVYTGAIGGLLTYLIATRVFDNPVAKADLAASVLSTSIYVCFAAPIFLLLFLAAATIFVGFASFYTTDADREWVARAGAWILIATGGWMALSSIVIFGPVVLFILGAKIVTAIGSAAGIVTVGGGASGRTAVNSKEEAKQKTASWTPFLKKIAVALAAPIFAVFLLIVLSLATSYLYRAIYDALADAGQWADGVRALLHIKPIAWGTLAQVTWDGTARTAFDKYGLLNIVYYMPGRFVLALTLVIVGVGVGMGFFVNINKFSLHGAYRDRLIRAYLGASRKKKKGNADEEGDGDAKGKDERDPNAFTGFDERDNMAMSALAKRPLHVVNMTLNLVSLSGEQLAWQDRKAESFTATRLFCGSFCIPRGYRESEKYGYDKGARRGISLGTAVAISGAAASPNMGYYSSTFVTFLLSLFNVRLGWWLGNPGAAGEKTYEKSGPTFGPRALVAETLGWTDDRHPYVYLSDGGHFENLGLYEMVLRRCQFIVVCDGSADPTLTFNDLGNAIGKVRDDLGIPIVFDDLPIGVKERDTVRSLLSDKDDEKYAAVGTICYSRKDKDAEDGVIVYIKPNIYGGEPADVFHYAKANPAFPHESTGDQMYSESQFESYRALGQHVVDILCKGDKVKDLETFKTQVCEYIGRPGNAVLPPKCPPLP